jgi:putative transcriptional regulator
MADHHLRALYSDYTGGVGSLRRMVDRLAELDQIDRATAHLRETKHGWQVSASAE